MNEMFIVAGSISFLLCKKVVRFSNLIVSSLSGIKNHDPVYDIEIGD